MPRYMNVYICIDNSVWAHESWMILLVENYRSLCVYVFWPRQFSWFFYILLFIVHISFGINKKKLRITILSFNAFLQFRGNFQITIVFDSLNLALNLFNCRWLEIPLHAGWIPKNTCKRKWLSFKHKKNRSYHLQLMYAKTQQQQQQKLVCA